MNLKFFARSSVGYSVPLFAIATMLMSLSVLGKNSKAYNQAFNACSAKMEDSYTDCLNMPYNSVAMCQNVANGVYKRCMRSKGFSALEAPKVGTNTGTKLPVKDAASPTATPWRVKPITRASVAPLQTMSGSSPTATPKSLKTTTRKQSKR